MFWSGVNWAQAFTIISVQALQVDSHLNEMTTPIFQPSILHGDRSQPAPKVSNLKCVKSLIYIREE